MKRPIITLLSDFGTSDTYVGQVKGACGEQAAREREDETGGGGPPGTGKRHTRKLLKGLGSTPQMPGSFRESQAKPGLPPSRRQAIIRPRRPGARVTRCWRS